MVSSQVWLILNSSKQFETRYRPFTDSFKLFLIKLFHNTCRALRIEVTRHPPFLQGHSPDFKSIFSISACPIRFFFAPDMPLLRPHPFLPAPCIQIQIPRSPKQPWQQFLPCSLDRTERPEKCLLHQILRKPMVMTERIEIQIDCFFFPYFTLFICLTNSPRKCYTNL